MSDLNGWVLACFGTILLKSNLKYLGNIRRVHEYFFQNRGLSSLCYDDDDDDDDDDVEIMMMTMMI